jgi:hypothetical protein
MAPVTLHGAKARGRVAQVDDADYSLVAQHRWHVKEWQYSGWRANGPYAMTRIDGKTVSMHKLLTGYPQTDHIDHDGLNNQRDNLRPVDRRRNQQNRRKCARQTTSDHKGVYWQKASGKWRAQICVAGRLRSLGLYLVEEDAARAYDAAALAEFGEYAHLNFYA